CEKSAFDCSVVEEFGKVVWAQACAMAEQRSLTDWLTRLKRSWLMVQTRPVAQGTCAAAW
ncbi:hypothetical protein KAJ02_06600, partial [Candidatus Bipolaricaulota bacterium]|nr:hypothetical protein [Candidatus Bipolaricaulota bacterium]